MPSARGGGRQPINSRTSEGKLIWAKLATYPWWPAQVLAEDDDFIPASNAEPPRRGAVPVRFFGSYDFAWIESQKGMAEWHDGLEEKVGRTPMPDLAQAVKEAIHFENTGQAPVGFEEAQLEEDIEKPKRPRSRRVTSESTVTVEAALCGGAGISSRARGRPAAKRMKLEPRGDTSMSARNMRVQRELALRAPTGSPHEHIPAVNPELQGLLERYHMVNARHHQ